MTVGELKDILQNISDDVEIYLNTSEGVVVVDEVEIDKYYGYVRKVIFK